MVQDTLAAPCGLNCEWCPYYIQGTKQFKCTGCWQRQCCEIRDCAKARQLRYCSYCEQFPCDKLYTMYGKMPNFLNNIKSDFPVGIHGAEYRFCPKCKGRFDIREIEDRKRLVCTDCNFVFYQNPAPAAAVIVHVDDKILLVRRKFEPRKGDWSLPAGFVEIDEAPKLCAIRETKEETNLDIEITNLFGVYAGRDDPRTAVILIVYEAKIISGELCAGDDVTAAQFFTRTDIPSNIAFRVHRYVLEEYFSKKGEIN